MLGAGGIVLTQLSFQVGALGATLPANLATDPLTGVVLGARAAARAHPALGRATWSPTLLCLAAVVAGAIRLADRPTAAGHRRATRAAAGHARRPRPGRDDPR